VIGTAYPVSWLSGVFSVVASSICAYSVAARATFCG